jgi:hypothetical protein
MSILNCAMAGQALPAAGSVVNPTLPGPVESAGAHFQLREHLNPCIIPVMGSRRQNERMAGDRVRKGAAVPDAQGADGCRWAESDTAPGSFAKRTQSVT